MGLLNYSNGWGHLIMSIVSMGVGIYLIILGYPTIGTGLIATVTAAWFIPGAAKQVAYSVENTVTPMAAQAAAGNTPTNPPATAPTVLTGASTGIVGGKPPVAAG